MEHNNYKILAINFGSTSTKIAVYAGEEKLLEHGFLHSCEDMEGVSTMEENAAMRKPLILDFLTHHGHSLESFDAVVGRGGDLLRQLHRPAHAEAEPGRLGQHHLHPWASRSARVSRMPRMCSMMSSVTRS